MELVTPGIGLIVWQTVVFLLVFVILAAFVWKPITEALHTRELFIKDALDSAENAKLEMQQLKNENEDLLKEARLVRDKIVNDAADIANKIKEDAKEDTAKITSKMIEDARSSINQEKNAALAEVKNLVATLSLEIAEKVLRSSLEDVKIQEKLVQDLVKDIKIG